MKKIVVEEPDNKKRLDKFLTEQLSDFSRSQIQKMIKNGQILVNEKTVAPHHFLKTNDDIKILDIKYFKTQNIQYPISKTNKRKIPSQKQQVPQPDIIFEDENILVINKPSGLLVHPRTELKKETEPTLIDWLIKKYPKIKKVGDNPKLRPGIVHRLDKEASGVMVVAKNQTAFESLKKQFHNHKIKKEYLALVYGQIKADSGKIDFPIGRAAAGRRMAARAVSAQGTTDKSAITFFEVLNRKPNCALIKAFPKTGRTHQIRVHFFALGNPLVGDQLYKSKNFKPILTGRLMLHSHKLTIALPSGEEKTFESPLPEEFKKFLP